MKTDLNHSATLNNINKKIQSEESCASSCKTWQNFFGKKIVLTHLCFDILHHGHIEYLAKAKDLGHALIVVIKSDEFIKSTSILRQNEQTRAALLASMLFVDGVVIFNEETPANLIAFLNPNILVQSSYFDANETNAENEKFISGSNVVRENGGEVITIDLIDDSSLTKIREKIKTICPELYKQA